MWHVIFTQCWQPHTHFLYHSHDCGRDLCAAEGICKYFCKFTGWSDIYGSVSVEAMLVMSQWVEVTAITTTERRRRAAISTSSFNAARTLNLSRTWMSWNRLWASARLAPVPGRAGLNILIFVHFVQNFSSLWRRTWRVAAHRLNITRG